MEFSCSPPGVPQQQGESSFHRILHLVCGFFMCKGIDLGFFLCCSAMDMTASTCAPPQCAPPQHCKSGQSCGIL